MNFPMTIADQQELNRLITDISKVTARETVEYTLTLLGFLNPDMSPYQCAKLSSRTRVDKALKNGALKFTVNSGRVVINRTDFNEWKKKNTFK